MSLNIINWVKGGKYREKILRLLNNRPMIPSELADALDISRASVSRILKDLYKMNLIDKLKSNTRTITYFLMDDGKKALKYFDEASKTLERE